MYVRYLLWIREVNDGLVSQDFSWFPLALLLHSWGPDIIPCFSQLYIRIPEEEKSSLGRREVSWLPGSEFSASVFISFGGKPTHLGDLELQTLLCLLLVAGERELKGNAWLMRKDSACLSHGRRLAWSPRNDTIFIRVILISRQNPHDDLSPLL